jgi:DivIVA domain-containing protein
VADLNYTTQQILQQQFKTKMRGYDPEEVDEFLDNIIRDYEEMQRELLDLRDENDHLQAQVDKLSKQGGIAAQVAARTQAPAEPAQNRGQAVTNFDILKRLSNLEREVFGSKLDNSSSSTANSNVSSSSASATRFEEPPVDDQATRLM